jgi:RHS repeat-associated protein
MAIYENGALKELPIYGSSRLGVYKVPATGLETDRDKLTLGRREYEVSNHLGNVLAVVSDLKLPAARVLSHTDYYAFGSAMPGRSGGAGYRHGFNGKENDAETGWQDYGFRLYHRGLGKFLSVDPITASYPMLTPYQFAGNIPIAFIDLDGLEPAEPTLYDVARYRGQVPAAVSRLSESFVLGQYTVIPNYTPDNKKLSHYTAVQYYSDENGQTQTRVDYVFAAKGLQSFKNAYALYQAGANGLYMHGPLNDEQIQAMSEDKTVAAAWAAAKRQWTVENTIHSVAGVLAPPIPRVGLSRLAREMSRQGKLGIVIAKNADDLRYLEAQGAEAVYFSQGADGFMMIRQGASRATVLEEIIHHNQKLKHGERFFFDNQVKLEIEAQDILLEIGAREKWSTQEIQRIKAAKEAWIKKGDKN